MLDFGKGVSTCGFTNFFGGVAVTGQEMVVSLRNFERLDPKWFKLGLL